MEIIKFTVDLIPQLWEIRLKALKDSPEAFGSTYESSASKTMEQVIDRFTNEWATNDHVAVGAFENGKFIGMAGLYRYQGSKERHKAGIWGMWVDPYYRGIGAGKSILYELIAYAKKMGGVEQINLTVVVSQLSARKLYESCGFTSYGLEKRALKIGEQAWDEEFMTLSLL